MRKQAGFSLVLGIIIAAIVGGLSLVLVNVLKANMHEATYLAAIRETSRMAESGMNQMIGELILNPTFSTSSTVWSSHAPISIDGGTVDIDVIRRNAPATDCYYIRTVATLPHGMGTFKVTRHSYATISNVGEYLAAVQDVLPIADGIDASQGKVYGNRLVFNMTSPATTRVRKAEYVVDCQPDPVTSPGTYGAIGSGTDVELVEPPPKKLNFPLLFPLVLASDIDRYKAYARTDDPNPNRRHIQCNFSGNIFPPGYQGGQITPPDWTGANRNYVDDNADHVYYCDENMRINGTVYGQVIFVSPKKITINGSLVKATTPPPYPGDTNFPSPPPSLASLAHQAILITQEDVVVSSDAFTAMPGSPPGVQTIEALILAPHGTFSAIPYDPPLGPGIHSKLQLVFNGSMVLNLAPQLSATFDCDVGTCPGGPRIYSYDDTFTTAPAPYLPSLSDIHCSFEVIDPPPMY